jgi:hypothetical protein
MSTQIDQTERDKDVLKLAKAVFDMSPEYWDNPNGAYESKCPFCGAVVYGGGEKPWADMSEITHETTCAYLIAKDLQTNL